MTTYTQNFNLTKEGLTMLQVNPDCAAQLDSAHKAYGWLYTKGADEQWVTLRKMGADELEIAHGQAADGAVLQGTKVRVA
jgi:hypothetical protein